MIIQWTQESVGEYRATWAGIALQLIYQPTVGRWWLWMTEGRTRDAEGRITDAGKTVRAGAGRRLLQWQSARDAKEHIDTKALAVVRTKQHPVAHPVDQIAVLKQFVKVGTTKMTVVSSPKAGGRLTDTFDPMMFVSHGPSGGLKPESAARRFEAVATKPRIHRRVTPVRKLVTK